jgi:hypothetical protein
MSGELWIELSAMEWKPYVNYYFINVPELMFVLSEIMTL